jgi:hypothetical protein
MSSYDGIFAKAGDVFYALLDDAPEGLVGTIGYAILKLSDLSVVTARTTAGITEIGTSGDYRATVTAPATQDVYLIRWDSGGVDPEYAFERLTVNASGSAPTIGTGYGEPFYTTQDDLRTRLGLDETALPNEDATALIVTAEDWIDRIIGPIEVDIDTGRKVNIDGLTGAQIIKLSDATLTIAAVLKNQPTAFTAAAFGSVSGPDFSYSNPTAGGMPAAGAHALRHAAALLDHARLRVLTGTMTGR